MHDDSGSITDPSFDDIRHAGNPVMSVQMQINRGGYDTNITWASAEYTTGNETIVGRYWGSGTSTARATYAHLLALRYKEPASSLGSEEGQSGTVDITVSVHHTKADGSDPQLITTASTTVDGGTIDPLALDLGSGTEQTFTSADPRMLRVQVHVDSLSTGASFDLAYDSATELSSLDTPTLTVPEFGLILIALVILIPVLTTLLTANRKRAVKIISVMVSSIVALSLLAGQVSTVTAAPDTYYLHDAGQSPITWYSPNWGYRRPITINPSQVPSDQNNFPVLISVENDADLATKARTDGFDILFTQADGTTKLSHEIEYYSAEVSLSSPWVDPDTQVGGGTGWPCDAAGDCSYIPTAGTDRLLVYMYSHEDCNAAPPTDPTVSVAFGGTAMTQAVTHSLQNGSCYYRTSIHYLAETNWPACTPSCDFIVTGPPDDWAENHSYFAQFSGVDQASPIVDTAFGDQDDSTATVTSGSFNVEAGGMAVASHAWANSDPSDWIGNSPTWTEGMEIVRSSVGTSGANTTSAYISTTTDTVFANADYAVGSFQVVAVASLRPASSADLVAWVEVPTVSSSSDTELYMYYGYPASSNQQDVTGTWGEGGAANYKGVWHLNEAVADEQTSGTHTNSTSASNDGTQNNNSSMQGMIAGGQDMDGTGDFIDVSSFTGITGYPVTISAWSAATVGSNGSFTAAGTVGLANDQYLGIGWSDTTGQTELAARNTVFQDIGGTLIGQNDWTHIVGVFETATDRRFYVDGSLANSDTISVTEITNPTIFQMGQRLNDQDGFMNVDEVRISSVVRSLDWIQTEYNNQNDPGSFFWMGLEETDSGPASPAGKFMNTTLGSGAATITFDTASQNAYWYTDVSYPTGGDNASIVAGNYTLNMNFNSLPASGNNWYNADWAYRKQITLDNTKVSGTSDLSYYPVLVSFSQPTLSVTRYVTQGADDAEEAAGGSVDIASSDLELVDDGSLQTVGVRFQNIEIPQGATITSAYLQFAADDVLRDADPVNLTIQGEETPSAPAFQALLNNITVGRPLTTASVPWSPANWVTNHDQLAAQRTPDIGSVVEEIVGQGTWLPGNALALIITGTGRREAESWNGANSTAELHLAPRLTITYATGSDTSDSQLRDTSNGGNVEQADGGDILFTDSAGTKLDHEIEKYDNTSGELIAWVEVPTVSYNTDTDIYLYCGNNTGVADQWNIAGTWDEGGANNYKGVWHLDEDAEGVGTVDLYQDSTSNTNHLDDDVFMLGKGGQIDGGQEFDDVYADEADIVDPGGAWTFSDGGLDAGTSDHAASAWVNLSSLNSQGFPTILDKGGGSSTSFGYWFAYENSIDGFRYNVSDGTNRFIANSNSSIGLAQDDWEYVTAVFDREPGTDTAYFYLNGASVGSESSSLIAGNSASGTQAFEIGGANWLGGIDEVRMADTVRTADWIATEYNNQSSPSTFYSVIGPQTPSSPGVDITVSVYHTSTDGSDPQLIVSSSSTTIDSATANPLALNIGAGGAQTYTAADPRLLRVLVTVDTVTDSGSFILDYDSVADPSSLDTPVVTVPEWGLAFLLLVPLVPFLMAAIWRRRRMAGNIASIALGAIVAISLLAGQVTPTTAAPDVFYLHTEPATGSISETGSATSIGNSSAASITHGLTINADDVIVAMIAGNLAGLNFSDDNGATPFTEQFEETNGGTSSSYAIYYRVAGASEPATYSWTLGSSTAWSLQIRVFSGVDTSSVWDVAPSASTRSFDDTGTANPAIAPTMTTSANGAMGIIAFFSDSTATFSSPTNGYGTEVEPASSRAQASYIRIWASAGATGTSSATMSASNDWTAHQFALKPGGVTPAGETMDLLEGTGSGGLDTGSGVDGSATLSASANISTDIIGTLRSGSADGISTNVTVNPLGTSISIGSITGFATGDDVLLINMQGASGDTADVGNYEILEISTVGGSTINVTSAIQNSYDGTTFANQVVRVQRIPQWTSVTINSSGSLTANAWDGTTGGILIFKASGTVAINGTGSIDAAGIGYLGGAGGVADGGINGESYDDQNGKGGDDGLQGTLGGGSGEEYAPIRDNTTGTRGGGGGGGSTGTIGEGGAGGAGGGYGGGGGGGGGGSDTANYISGAGGAGGTTGDSGGGGHGEDSGTSGNGGDAGNPASDGGVSIALGGGLAGSGTTTGQGGHAEDNADSPGGGGGGGGNYGIADLTQIFFGSGGGGGGDSGAVTGDGETGGDGGGIIFIIADIVDNNATIQLDGADGITATNGDGASGGGAGGSLMIQANTWDNTGGTITAAGGAGGAKDINDDAGGGGGGGVGRIRIEADSRTGTTTPTYSPAGTPGGGGTPTKTFNSVGSTYWYHDVAWPTGNDNATMAAGDYTFNMYFNSLPSSPSPWYDTNWPYRKQITVQFSQVDSTESNIPVYVDLADLSSDFFASVNVDGGDIRVTNSDGVTEMAREVVAVNKGGETGELHFRADSLSSSVNTSFYIYYGNSGASDYAVTATYGRNAVWSNNYDAVYHLEEDAVGITSNNLYIDSTGNGYDGDDRISATGQTGRLGAGQELDGSDDFIDMGDVLDYVGPADFTLESWIRPAILAGGGSLQVSGTSSFTNYDAANMTDGTVTFQHTVPSGNNRLLLVAVSFNNDNLETVTGVTYNGDAMTWVGNRLNSDDAYVEIWSKVAPEVGTNMDIVVTFSTDPLPILQGGTAGATNFINAEQVDPDNADFVSFDASSAGPATIDVTSTTGELVYAVVGCETCTSLTPVSMTEQWNDVNPLAPAFYGAAATKAGTTTTTMEWTLGSNDHWAIGAIPIRPAAGGGALRSNVIHHKVGRGGRSQLSL